MSWTSFVSADWIPNCRCGKPLIDKRGNVVRVSTCPACQQIRLDVVRGTEYACAYVNGGDTVERVLVKQKDFFSA